MPQQAHHTAHHATHPAANAFWLDSLFGPPPVREILDRIQSDLSSGLSSGLPGKPVMHAIEVAPNRPYENLAALIHDTRSMVSAIDLYCDLLEEPGVINEPFRQYSSGLRHVGATSRRLLEAMLEAAPDAVSESPARLAKDNYIPIAPRADFLLASSNLTPSFPQPPHPALPSPKRQIFHAVKPVANLAAELRANLNLISALVGPAITVGLSIDGGDHPIAMAADDLTRILVNLARNAADAMPQGGHIQIAIEERFSHMSLSIADTGPGIPESALESIFSPGFTTNIKVDPPPSANAWPVQHRGLGLFIVRSIVSAAGGLVWAGNRASLLPGEAPAIRARIPVEASLQTASAATDPLQTGAILWIEFPVAGSEPASEPGSAPEASPGIP